MKLIDAVDRFSGESGRLHTPSSKTSFRKVMVHLYRYTGVEDLASIDQAVLTEWCLCNDPAPSRGLRKLVAQGRLDTRSLAGYWTRTPEQVQAERARFEAVLGAAAELLARSPAQLPD